MLPKIMTMTTSFFFIVFEFKS